MKVIPTDKVYGYRATLSYLLVKIANWIYPEHPMVRAFYVKALHDYMIYGGYTTLVDWKHFRTSAKKSDKKGVRG